MSVLGPRLGIDLAELELLCGKYAAAEEEPPPLTIKVDLDGTLAEHYGDTFDPQVIKPPRPGARERMIRWKSRGYRLLINTVRGERDRVRDYLAEHEIPYDYINYNPDQPAGSSHKLIADIDVDDTAVDAAQPWDKIEAAVERKIKLLKAASLVAQVAADLVSLNTKTASATPDAPREAYYGDTAQLPSTADYVLQRHLAVRAGPHFDLRLGDPRGLYSWVLRHGLPGPGGQVLARQQPMHSYRHKDFAGTIPSGRYGAGVVHPQEQASAEVVERAADRVRFLVAQRLYELSRQGDSRDWLLKNVTAPPQRTEKAAAGSRMLQAFRQVTPQYDPQRPFLANLLDYLRSVYAQGRHNIGVAYNDNRILQTFAPERAQWPSLNQVLSGKNPITPHPLDQAVQRIGP